MRKKWPRMNTLQRLISNTFLAFVSNIVVKASSSILFILMGRLIGPDESGIYNLGVTFFTIVFALSSWGLHELLVREVAPRREESSRYLVNYLVLRLLLSGVFYGLLLLFLRFNLPYSDTTKLVIRTLSLAIFPEAIFSICQALFIAHEQLTVPTVAAFVNSGLKLGAGAILLLNDGRVTEVAQAIPISSMLSLGVFIIALPKLLKSVPQQARARFDLHFSLTQLRYTPGFVVIGIFATLDFQIDTLLISLLLSEVEIGWYGAAQTIMLGFWMMPVAIRTVIYPLMARYYHQKSEKLAELYYKTNQYLLIVALPMAAGISLLAKSIITLVFGDSFDPAAPALSITIWAIVFAFLNVPSARLLLVYNRQQQAGWMTGLSMVVNFGLNLWLIPLYGIVGSAFARVLSSFIYFLSLYLYVQMAILKQNILPLVWRPLIATMMMVVVVRPFRNLMLFWPVVIGLIVYVVLIFLLRIVSKEDRHYWRQLFYKLDTK